MKAFHKEYFFQKVSIIARDVIVMSLEKVGYLLMSNFGWLRKKYKLKI